VATAVLVLVLFAAVSVLLIVLSRRQARQRPDLWGDWMRRHRLSAAEAGEISTGVTRGLRYTDPRLRAAATDWAGTMLRTEFSDRMMALFIGLYLVPVALTIVLQPHDANWFVAAIYALSCAVVLRRRRGVRHSLEENGGVPGIL